MKNKKSLPSAQETWGLLGGLGFSVAVPPAILTILGVYLDGIAHTSPLFLLLGLLLGLSSGVYGAYRLLKRFF